MAMVMIMVMEAMVTQMDMKRVQMARVMAMEAMVIKTVMVMESMVTQMVMEGASIIMAMVMEGMDTLMETVMEMEEAVIEMEMAMEIMGTTPDIMEMQVLTPMEMVMDKMDITMVMQGMVTATAMVMEEMVTAATEMLLAMVISMECCPNLTVCLFKRIATTDMITQEICRFWIAILIVIRSLLHWEFLYVCKQFLYFYLYFPFDLTMKDLS